MKRLQNLSYKTLFIILFFSLAGIVFFLKIGGKTTKVSAAWWDDMWHYRKAISVTNSSGSNQNNFQIKILDNYDLSALVTDGKLQSDLDDLRFTDINGNLISYWIEDTTNNSVDVWGIIPSLPTSGTSIYMYYGNSSAANGETVFGTQDKPGLSCKSIKLSGATLDNIYYIDPTGGNVSDAIQIYCDLNTDSGGWMLIGKSDSTIYTHAPGFFSDGNIPTKVNRGSINVFSLSLIKNNAEWMWQDTVNSQYVKFNLTKFETIKASPDTYTSVADDVGLRFISSNINSTSSLYQFTAVNSVELPANAGSFSYATSTETTTYGRWGNAYYAGGSQSGARIFMITNYGGHEGAYGKYGLQRYNPAPYIALNSVLMVREAAFSADSNFTSTLQSEESGGGPIAYWKFDEGIGTTAYDSTGNNNGMISGATYVNEDQCISGKCLQFNGTTNFIKINQSATINYLKQFTISFWIKHDGTNTDKYIFYKGSSGPYAVNINGNIISLNYWNTSAARTNGIASVTVSPNQWHQVTITFKENDIAKSYIDGALANSTAISSSIATNTSDLYFNTYNGTTNSYNVKGLFDEVKIYPYARTAAQIKTDYNSRGSLSGSSANLGVQSNTSPSLKSSLVAYWKFDENSGTTVYDSSENNLPGIFGPGSSAPTWTQGKSNRALSFDGSDDFISVADNDLLDTPNDYTISMWVYNQAGSKSWPTLLNRASASTSNGYFWIYTTGTNESDLNFQYSNGTYQTVTFSNSLNLNTWNHISFTFNNSTKELQLFVDGKKFSTTRVLTNPLPVDDGSLYIGTYQGNPTSYPFNGFIDEVKIYNRALTAEEIKQDYNQGSAIQFGTTNQTIGGTTTSLDYCIPGDTSYCASPIAEWKMDEGVGTSITDTSGNNNTGTISGATFTQGKIGKSLNFNGESSSVYVSTQYPLSSLSSFTTEAWIKPNSISGIGEHSTYGYTIMAASADGSRYPVWITLRNGEIRASAFVGALAYAETIGANIQTNNWYHIAVSAIQNGAATIYINGIGKTSFTAGNIAWNTADKLTISDLRPTRNISFNGSIDHVKIYNYARTPAQIAYDYNHGGPVGWWKLDECQGNIAYDWSGVGNTGTINIGSGGSQNSLGTCTVGTSAAWTNGAVGKINSSLNFDGTDDKVSIGNPNNLKLASGDFSVAAWVNPSRLQCGMEGVDKSNNVLCGNATNGGWVLGATSNYLGFLVSDSTNVQYQFLKSTYSANTWYHLVGIKKNNNIYLYINGKYHSTADITGYVINDSYNLTLGGNVYWRWPGQLDDVRIYNYALTSEQIKNIYNGGAINFQ